MAALLVFVAVVAVYMTSLGGPFLWDDRLLILDAPLIERGGSLGDFLSSPFWAAGAFSAESTSYYRPLVTLSFALDRAVHGNNPGGYHLTNVVLHATNALLLHALLKKHGARPGTAALLATGWALLPRLAEAAAWISGRTDVLASLFTFGALLAWGPGLGRRILGALLIGTGLLAKESAVAGALAIAAGAWVARGPTPKRFSRTLIELAPLGAALVLYGALRLQAVGFRDEVADLGVLGRLRTSLEAAGTYAAMLVDAFRPRAVIGRIGVTSAGGLAAGIAVVALVAALFRFRSRLGSGTATGLGLCFGALLPVLHIVPIPLLTLAADRFLYLPVAGLALAVAPALDRFLAERRARWAGALSVVALLAIVTFERVAIWSDEITFWVETYLETPKTNSAAAKELAAVYFRAGLFEDALILSERALRYDDPRRKNAEYNAGLCLVRLGHYDRARVRLTKVRGKGRTAADVELQLAMLEIRTGRFDVAKQLLVPLARTGQPAPRLLLAKLGELEQARRELDQLGPSGPPERRAPLASLLADDAAATRAWLEVLALPSVSQRVADEALRFLVQQGDRQALTTAASAYVARFGDIDSELAAMIEVHVAELDRLVAARERLGLSGPERTREIAVSGQ
ncbi:MAG TPA: tetratricopeptide repeat protein [Polyangiaceae bacterium]|nr:tetratricopeptide repeat protein [Polyangiaceae bacterium]